MSVVLQLRGVKKTFERFDNPDLLVLHQLNLRVLEGEILAILGKTGCGKSTLLRIMSGLVKPTSGDVLYREQEVSKPISNMSMVFQNFALLPWLTVLKNVELGLLSQNLPIKTQREKALKAIDIVGMDGFESAYPKELSGGMAQRVGIARALVAEPEILLMDEAFSALDVLTAENLRNDLLDLWANKQTKTKSIVFVTHNIEEAVLMADRIVILSSDPGSVIADMPVNLPRPRQTERNTPFWDVVDEVYQCMAQTSKLQGKPEELAIISSAERLPSVSIPELTGLLETIHDSEHPDEIELSQLAEDTHLEADELFSLTDVLSILNFISVKEGKVLLTFTGKSFAQADILKRKRIFATQLLGCVPLARLIRMELDKSSNHMIQEGLIMTHLEQELSKEEAGEVLKTVIDWGRYAEIFAYHANEGVLSLENPE
jgi:NitT/TauT family transport system ATP-binding protein